MASELSLGYLRRFSEASQPWCSQGMPPKPNRSQAWMDGAPDLARARRSRYYAFADRPRRMVARLERRFSS